MSTMSSHIPLSVPVLGERERELVAQALADGWVSYAGPYVTRFEEAFSKKAGVTHAVAMTNGTAALHLALKCLDIGPGDEVIVPTLTFVATVNAIRYSGATPIFVDSERTSFNLDSKRVAEAITAKTRAIMVVHLFGAPANMGPILELASRHRLQVIEDAAEAFGATWNGMPVGTIGDIGCFSFNGNKLITTGGGGMFATADKVLAERARFLSTQARPDASRYYHTEVGYNYRLTSLQAALGLAQLESFEERLQIKRHIAEKYAELLSDLSWELPQEPSWGKHAWWLYSVLVKPGVAVKLVEALRSERIEARRFFEPVHTFPPYGNRNRRSTAELPIATELAECGVNLPSSVNITDEDIERVADALIRFSSSNH